MAQIYHTFQGGTCFLFMWETPYTTTEYYPNINLCQNLEFSHVKIKTITVRCWTSTCPCVVIMCIIRSPSERAICLIKAHSLNSCSRKFVQSFYYMCHFLFAVASPELHLTVFYQFYKLSYIFSCFGFELE